MTDMKYTFVDGNGVQRQVVVPTEVLTKGRRQGWSNRETLEQYLYDNGYIEEEPVHTETKRKARTRKPNAQKAELIEEVRRVLETKGIVTVVNPEKLIQVEIDGKTFEFNLVQKRKPKAKE